MLTFVLTVRTSDPDLHLPLNQKERRKSDFLTHYEVYYLKKHRFTDSPTRYNIVKGLLIEAGNNLFSYNCIGKKICTSLLKKQTNKKHKGFFFNSFFLWISIMIQYEPFQCT